MRANFKGALAGTTRDTPEQNRISRDKKGKSDQREELEMWIAKQTSFPRKQDGKVEMSDPRVLGSNIVSPNSAANQSNFVREKSRHLAPPVAPSSRSASPALSIRSAQSGASRVSHHSGTSEVSVVSVLQGKFQGNAQVISTRFADTFIHYFLCARNQS
jgi:hypothetical protein